MGCDSLGHWKTGIRTRCFKVPRIGIGGGGRLQRMARLELPLTPAPFSKGARGARHSLRQSIASHQARAAQLGRIQELRSPLAGYFASLRNFTQTGLGTSIE